MSEEAVPEGEDAADVYDKAHGVTTNADEQKPVNLSEAANKPPPQAVSFKVSSSGK